MTSRQTDDFGGAEGVEAVHDGDANANVDFGGLTVGLSSGDALSEGLEAAHPRLDAAAGVVPRPAFPEGPALISGRAQGLVAARAAAQSFFHGGPFLRIGMIRTASRAMMVLWQRRVIGAVRGHRADLFVGRDLPEQVR